MISCGIDIGGANIKIYRGEVESYYFPMWKKRNEFKDFLRSLNIKADRVGVVITAELSDTFKRKDEGIRFIETVVKKYIDGEVYFMNINGELKKEIDDPKLFSASNWMASALYLSKEFDSFILADMGSTTTDVIPVYKKKVIASKTDFERLKRDELIYIGLLRTPLCYILADEKISSEFFSITADAMRVIGLIDEKDYSCDTPDNRGRDYENCMQRIARQFCCDLEDVGIDFILEKAKRVRDIMIEKVSFALNRKKEELGIKKVIGCGIGESILKTASYKVGMKYISLKEKYGNISKIFPAFAVAKLVEEI